MQTCRREVFVVRLRSSSPSAPAGAGSGGGGSCQTAGAEEGGHSEGGAAKAAEELPHLATRSCAQAAGPEHIQVCAFLIS